MAKRPPPRELHTLADLTDDPQNANRGTARGRTLLHDSLATYGAGRSILTDRTGTVIAGNKTLEQARTLDLPIQTVQSDGRTLVVVQRTDLDLEAGGTARALALADNRIGEVNLAWDEDLLRRFTADGDTFRDLWTETELTQLTGRTDGTDDARENAIVPIPEAADTTHGDLFELGAHRLLCGDATNAAHVAAVLREESPALLVTDPPYGVSYDPAWRLEAGRRGRHAVGAVAHDDRADWTAALAHFTGPVLYVWHAGIHSGTVARMVTDAGFDIRAQIIWVKSHFVLGRGDFHWQHEPCFYGVRHNQASHWRGGRTQSTVWTVANLNPFAGGPDTDNPRTGHSTQKPVLLYERPLLFNSTKHDIVVDLFGGSGTMLIAAQKTGRRARVIEIDPRYVQMAVQRWETYTGETARRFEVATRT
jgi:DNA modification methylase